VIVARPAASGIEVLGLTRSARSRFAPGYVVFPGGSVEAEDLALAVRLFGKADETARACAVRELYEEAGVLLTADGAVAAPPRGPLAEVPFEPPRVAALPEVARWIAPDFLDVRFDAIFFAAAAPVGLDPIPDGTEIARAEWMSPAALLAAGEERDVPLAWPTRITLRALARCATVAEVLALRVEQVPPPR
jgi:8-oxo-dGTP pyrophosphatase MutT (NUDIX family)